MTTLLLIRHGQSQANLQGIFAGHLNVDLTEIGLTQAERTAEYIAENYRVDAVYASDLMRAYKTGKATADRFGLPVIADEELREIRAGKWSGETFDILPIKYGNDYALWLSDIGNSSCTGGETVRQLGARILSAVTKIAMQNDEKTVVIATHATPIRVLQCLISGHTFDEMKNIPWVANCSVTEIHYDGTGWELTDIGYDKHLTDLRTAFPPNV